MLAVRDFVGAIGLVGPLVPLDVEEEVDDEDEVEV